jgi:uncharacterized protein (TIGR03084 family)
LSERLSFMAQTQDHSFVDVLDAEYTDLASATCLLTEDQWNLPTSAEGWSVKNSLSHLADTEDIARHTLTGGPRTFANEAKRLDGRIIPAGVAKGQVMTGAEVFQWFDEASDYNRAALRRTDTSLRVPWGIGMSWRSFVTARLMEMWAHGLEIREALNRPGKDTDRLEYIAWLSLATVPYALNVAHMEIPPDHSLRLELTGPQDQKWAFGPDDATDIIRGDAGLWCRRAVQRITTEEAEGLERIGPLAALAFQYARCYL